jgi:uncharacterized protein
MDTLLKNPVPGLLPPHLSAENLSFPQGASNLKALQTHISIVFLAGDFAYKIKKPVRFLFVDYSTLEKRRAFCEKEVELNRRLAPQVYLGVVPVTRQGNRLSFEGEGEAVEYAVKMRRLPDENRLNRLLEVGRLPKGFWETLVDRLVSFYGEAARGPEISHWAEPESVEEDWSQILSQIRNFPPEILDPGLWSKLEYHFQEEWNRLMPWIENRIGRAREGHGDLRMEHIYCFPGEAPPGDLAIIDCVEFDPRYRCSDPMLEIAFLVMDLEAQGFSQEASLLSYSWISKTRDEDGDLLAFYTAYRHLVRGLVRGLQAQEAEIPPADQQKAADKARLHFRMALSKLAPPEDRPCLALLSGLPGTGKSSLSRSLEKDDGFQALSSDFLRKQLAGLPPSTQPPAGWNQGFYTPEWTDKTYAALLAKAEEGLLRGQRVLIDASFWEQSRREPFFQLARRLKLPFLFLVCRAPEKIIRERLQKTERYGSDADFGVYQRMAESWQEPPADWEALNLDTERPLPETLREIERALARLNLSRL